MSIQPPHFDLSQIIVKIFNIILLFHWYSLVDWNAKDCPFVSFGLSICESKIRYNQNGKVIILSQSFMKRKWKLCKWHKLASYLLIIASYRGEKFNLDRNYYWVYVRRGRKWFQLELSSRVALIKPGGKRASCVHSNVTYSNKITCFTFDMSSLH